MIHEFDENSGMYNMSYSSNDDVPMQVVHSNQFTEKRFDSIFQGIINSFYEDEVIPDIIFHINVELTNYNKFMMNYTVNNNLRQTTTSLKNFMNILPGIIKNESEYFGYNGINLPSEDPETLKNLLDEDFDFYNQMFVLYKKFIWCFLPYDIVKEFATF